MQHLQLGGEDRTVLFAQLASDRVPIALQIGRDRVDRLPQTSKLILDGVVADEPAAECGSLRCR